MSFMELAWKRRSVRNFKPDDVTTEKVVKLIDAARAAPSAGNCQPWHFYAIKDAEMKERLNSAAGGQDIVKGAPLCIVVCADLARTAGRYGDRGRNLYCIQDTAAAIQNLLLCAVEEGLAACWCGAFDEQGVAQALELSADLRPVAIIPVGYPASDVSPRDRRQIAEICSFIGFE